MSEIYSRINSFQWQHPRCIEFVWSLKTSSKGCYVKKDQEKIKFKRQKLQDPFHQLASIFDELMKYFEEKAIL